MSKRFFDSKGRAVLILKVDGSKDENRAWVLEAIWDDRFQRPVEAEKIEWLNKTYQEQLLEIFKGASV